MNADVENLVLEHLRHIRSRVDAIDEQQREMKESLLATRVDVHALRGDILRFERGLAAVELTMDKVKLRLGLGDDTL